MELLDLLACVSKTSVELSSTDKSFIHEVVALYIPVQEVPPGGNVVEVRKF